MPNGDSTNPVISNDFADIIVDYIGTEEEMKQRYKADYIHNVDSRYAIAYVPYNIAISENLINAYSAIPKVYGLMEFNTGQVSITERPNRPGLNLSGTDTLVAIIDTGIDYTNELFRKPDGSSKIAAIWDQTIESGRPPSDHNYGTEYVQDDITIALANNDPLSVIPSVDTIGHGTFLSGVIAGNNSPDNDFYSVAPNAELIVVKLKYAKPYIKKYFAIPSDSISYQETDIIQGIQYAIETAGRLNKPIAVCIALGSSQTNHDVGSLLSNYMDYVGSLSGRAIIIAAGNEGFSRHHYYKAISEDEPDAMQLHIADNEGDFLMEIWGSPPNEYYVEVLSPSGELAEKATFNLVGRKKQTAQLGNTSLDIEYNVGGVKAIEELIILRFHNPSPGVWTIRVYARGDLTQGFHAWLPINQFISPDTFFLSSDPYTTITSPGNSSKPITVSGCDLSEKIFYKYSGRGFTGSNDIKPDIAAPCENIMGPTLSHQYELRSGTSLAAAYVTGITANLFEWAITNKNYVSMNNYEVKRLLIRGATRRPNITYPDKEWGYGVCNLLGTFNEISKDANS